MNPKPTILLAALFALAGPASADPFSVGFLCTIEAEWATGSDGSFQPTSGIAGLPIGSQFRGSYSYDAPSADGTFRFRGNTPGGSIDMPAQLYSYGALAILDMAGWLTVANGLVTEFVFCPALGPFDANFLTGRFSMGNRNLETGARGSISWDAPAGPAFAAAVADVPEGGSVAVMVVLGILACRLSTTRYDNTRPCFTSK